MSKKEWRKPVVLVLKKEEIKNFIKAAARSGGVCFGGGYAR